MIEYLEDGDLAVFDNCNYRKDKKTGYFLCAKPTHGKRMRLHRAVWEHYHGAIPNGHHIHHKDENKDNNELENLELLGESDHMKWHRLNMDAEKRAQLILSLAEKARPMASEWHGSDAGKEWHKKHYERFKDRLHQQHVGMCVQCGKEFSSSSSISRFCSNNCKSAYRRKMGFDNIIKKCEGCGNEYIANKYASTKYCSAVCRNKGYSDSWAGRRLQHGSRNSSQL
jgi:hypothetical protein